MAKLNIQDNNNMDNVFNMNDNMYDMDTKYKKRKQLNQCCYLGTGFIFLNLLYTLGGGAIFYYMYLQKYINLIENNIDGTFLDNSTEIKDILIKFPIIINKICDELGC